ncbi:MAG: ferredoxin [Thermodesulfobacteriota bacterium]
MAYIIAEPCVDVKDKACVEACPVDCIYEGDSQLFIHPEECIDCGACVDPCPVDAIFHEDELPEKWSEYTEMNADFFEGKEGLEPARKD